ncbi:HigA family addiction module antitoxin [Treponema pedis]|nr:HigA family addiction module antitoxin [Treponema pedis]QSI05819.1 addiction module antidote protein, HigA family [Treponema pedis]
MKYKLKPVHAGDVLLQEFMEPLNITVYKLAQYTGMSQTRIGQIIKKKRGISVDTALRLAKVFDTSAAFWLNIQNKYDIDIAVGKHSKEIEALQPIKHIAFQS